MKRISTLACVASLAMFGIAGFAAAEDVERGVDIDVKVRTKGADAEGQREGAKVVVARNYRASTIVGMEVKNAQGQDLGEIHELVVDLDRGKVRYAALSFGGFLGLGDKLFAIPWHAMTLKHGEDDRHMVLNITKQKLEAAPGFDKDNWPDVASPAWAEKIDKHYGTDRTERTSALDETERSTKPRDAAATARTFRISYLTGMDVKNPDGEDVGSINELVIDVSTGKVSYVAMSHGGVLGVGDKLFAVPFKAFKLSHDGDDRFFVVNVDQQRLEDAPGFDKDNWPNTADPKWGSGVDEYYNGRQAKARTTTTRE